MPSVIRAILLALHATAFTALTQTTTCAVAVPLPPPPALYTRTVLSLGNTSQSLSRSMRIVRNPTSLSLPSSPHTADAEADPYSKFVSYYQAASQDSRNIKILAAQSVSVKANDSDFQKKCVTQLNSFHTNVLGQQAALDALSAEKRRPGKGLDNFDHTNDIETLIKNTVNLNKDTLTAFYVLVKKLPILGPVLGPIVYDIKCYLDAMLNFCEIFLDATINGVQPLLRALLGSTPTGPCPFGTPILGLCL
ncbi:hypothetical protein FPV67DRAFT_65417 [Lyophyllum atratum]|nr:hypothetical protein FPV67DRAFT_65417 [Lyophyllum atratum]